MEDDQEQKQYVCKFCNKRFLCGRSLGGHMRSHMSNNSSLEEKEKLLDNNKKKRSSSSALNGGLSSSNNTDFEAGGGGGNSHVGYGLRENPKKTWRLSHSIGDGNLKQDSKVCRECGKGFQSWKALFGHMRCHSDNKTDNLDGNLKQDSKVCRECGKGFQSWKALFGHMRCHSDNKTDNLDGEEEDSWIGENQKLVMDNQSDNEAATAAAPKRRRSRLMRYKNTSNVTAATTTTTTTSSSFSFANGFTSMSEIEQEQEEVAMSLMMLSRDVGYWGGVNPVVEASDNNSVVLEVRLSSLVATENADKEEDYNAGQIVTVKKLRGGKKLKSVVLESENARFEKKRSELANSSFGFLRNGFKNVQSEVSVDGFIGEDKFELGKIGAGKCTEAKMGENLIEDANEQADSECGQYSSSKRSSKCDAYGLESLKKMRSDASGSEVGKYSSKLSKYECSTCNKTFHSYQALGGHRASHKKVKGCFASKVETSENSIETEITPEPTADSKAIKFLCSNVSPNGTTTDTSSRSKKNKHECPICFKVFASGQALGGHKRSHVIEGSEARGGSQGIVIQKMVPEIRDLLDLNLPAPVEEDATNVHIGFKPWWVGSNIKHETPVVGLI